MNGNLNGKRALVAGSTQGIGLAIAKELSAMGASCTLLARNAESLKTALSELAIHPGSRHEFLVADFNQPDVLRDIIQDYMKNNHVQILINNSGGPPSGPITEAGEDAFLQAFRQHLICNQILAQAVLPSMIKTGYGRIINIISTSVRIPLKNLGVSNTIRGAVASWAKTLSNEVAAHQITVNNILPGATLTGRLSTILRNTAEKTGKSLEEAEQHYLSEIPMQRFAKPEEIAAVAGFLASPAASYVTGVSIPVDGGRTGSI
jgi:3-oxoacyl-[acyl-carrier protein] reductase